VDCADPADFQSCTFVANAAQVGSHISSGLVDGATTLTQCILAFGIDGGSVSCPTGGDPVIEASCTDIFGNEGGNWIECLGTQLGLEGNVELDPEFCGLKERNFEICSESPCAPEHSNGCGLIGAYDVGCDPSSLETKSWGHIKGLYRE
jgi:hypothetical protein